MGRYCPNCPKKIGKPKAKKGTSETSLRTPASIKQIKIYRSRMDIVANSKIKPARQVINKLNKNKVKIKNKSRFVSDTQVKSKKHISRHTYYGVSLDELNQYSPSEGDTFVNLLTGEWSIYRHEIWSNIPTPGPRTYLGPSMSPDSAVPYPKEGSLYFDAEGRIYVYQANEWQLVPITMNPSLPSITLQNKKTTLTVSPDLSNPTLKTQTLSFKLGSDKSGGVNIKLDTMTNAHYHSLVKPSYGLNNSLEFQVVPTGEQKITLSNLKNNNFLFTFGTWIQYTDNDQQSWQTVVGISDLILYDKDRKPIKEYKIVPESDPDKLTFLMEDKYLTTTTASQEIRIKSKTEIEQAEWTYHLLAYPVGMSTQFYLIKDFHDLEKQLDQPLPVVRVQISK